MEILNLKVEQYEGPLDLLLALISKHKIDIFDIPISEICEQYIAYLDAMRKLDMEVTSEFVVMAAELMLIKSKMLLPRTEESEDPRAPLVDALLEHQRAKAAAEFLKMQSAGHFDTFTKPASEPEKSDYSRGHAVELLTEAFARIADRVALRKTEGEPELFKRIEERYYSVEEKSEAIMGYLKSKRSCLFIDLFIRVRSRSEAVAVFMALLELVRDGLIDVEGNGEDIELSIADALD
ncbi:MAG: segregation/condensation protein A [Clostridia bacterium]|nr:segregation/condensation protein A [Clostridia bacterium]MBR6783335.1 segregation/condensation protein A [Clostridia bacterium]